jgi:SpoVK/Ycf46/Vps4 family AAA+-type ATPase
MAGLCLRMKMIAANRQLQSSAQEQVTPKDAAAALAQVQPSVTHEQVQRYAAWRKEQKV